MSSENGVRPLTCFSLSLPTPKFKTQLTSLSITPKICLPPSSWEEDTMIIRSAYVKDSKWDAARVNFTATDLQFLWVRRFLFPSAVAVNIVSPASRVFGDILVGSIIINLKHIQEITVFFRVQKRKETQAWKEMILKKVKLKMVTESIKLRKL